MFGAVSRLHATTVGRTVTEIETRTCCALICDRDAFWCQAVCYGMDQFKEMLAARCLVGTGWRYNS